MSNASLQQHEAAEAVVTLFARTWRLHDQQQRHEEHKAKPGDPDEADVEAACRGAASVYGLGGALHATPTACGPDHLPFAALIVNTLLDRVVTGDTYRPPLRRRAVECIAAVCGGCGVRNARSMLPGVASKLLGLATARLRSRCGTPTPTLRLAIDRLTLASMAAISSITTVAFAPSAPTGAAAADDAWAAASYPRFAALADATLRTLANAMVDSALQDAAVTGAGGTESNDQDEVALRVVSSFAATCACLAPRIPPTTATSCDGSAAVPEAAWTVVLLVLAVAHGHASALGLRDAVLRTPGAVDRLRATARSAAAAGGNASNDPLRRAVCLGGFLSLVGEETDQQPCSDITTTTITTTAADTWFTEGLSFSQRAVRLCARVLSGAVRPGNKEYHGAVDTAVAVIVDCLLRIENFQTRAMADGLKPNSVKARRCGGRTLESFLLRLVMPLIDDWDAYELHAGALLLARHAVARAVAAAGEGRSTSKAVAAHFVFGGAWTALWDITGRTRHVWMYEDRWSECSTAQRSLRIAVFRCAIQCVVGFARTVLAATTPGEGGSTDAVAPTVVDAWLQTVVPALLSRCVVAGCDEELRACAMEALSDIALATATGPRAPSASTPHQERQLATAALLTRCADYVIDAGLWDLRIACGAVDRSLARARRDDQYRASATAEEVEEEDDAEKQEADNGDDRRAEEEDDRSVASPCAVLRAFALVAGHAMRQPTATAAAGVDATVSGGEEDPAVNAARHGMVCDVGAQLQPYVAAVLTGLRELLAQHHTRDGRTVVHLLRTITGLCAVLRYGQAAYDGVVAARGGLPPLLQPQDGSLVETRDAEYDRNLPRWLEALHGAVVQCLDTVTPLVHAPLGGAAVRAAAVECMSAALDALCSSLEPRRIVDVATASPEQRPSSSEQGGPACDGGTPPPAPAVDDMGQHQSNGTASTIAAALQASLAPRRRISDNYLPLVYRAFNAVVANLSLLDTGTSASSSGGGSSAVLGAMDPTLIASAAFGERSELLLAAGTGNETVVAASSSRPLLGARAVVRSIAALPLRQDHATVMAIDAGRALACMAPLFIGGRVVQQVLPLAALHYTSHCMRCERHSVLERYGAAVWRHGAVVAVLEAAKAADSGAASHGGRVAAASSARPLHASSLRGRALERALREMTMASRDTAMCHLSAATAEDGEINRTTAALPSMGDRIGELLGL